MDRTVYIVFCLAFLVFFPCDAVHIFMLLLCVFFLFNIEYVLLFFLPFILVGLASPASIIIFVCCHSTVLNDYVPFCSVLHSSFKCRWACYSIHRAQYISQRSHTTLHQCITSRICMYICMQRKLTYDDDGEEAKKSREKTLRKGKRWTWKKINQNKNTKKKYVKNRRLGRLLLLLQLLLPLARKSIVKSVNSNVELMLKTSKLICYLIESIQFN